MMKKKKWMIITTVVFVLLVLGCIPFVINWAYKQNRGYVTMWGAADTLSFYAEFLGAIGTIGLGLVAYMQNKKLHDSQKRLETKKLRIETYALFNFSNFSIKFKNTKNDDKRDVNCIETGFNGNVAFWKYDSLENMDRIRIQCNIKNIGLFPAVDIFIADEHGNKAKDSNTLSCASINETNDKKYIINGGTGTIVFNVDIDELRKKKSIDYFLKYKNPFGYKYSQKIAIISRYIDQKIIEIDAQGYFNEYMEEDENE